MERNAYELHFSPLQGYTNLIFRNAFERYFGGIDAYYTPFIRVEKGGFRNKDLREVMKEKNGVGCLIPQILPGTPEEFRLLADMLWEKGYQAVDINLGCPFPLIAGKRKGAGMLPFVELVKDVLETTREYPEIRFSLKMRLGWENANECLQLVDVINSLRLHHVTVHARTGKQQYKGETHPQAFGDFYERCRHPLFYNGDLHSLQDIKQILEKFPMLRGVSVGRGLVSSPFMGKEFHQNETFSLENRMSLLSGFHEALFTGYAEVLQGETQLLIKMKTLWEYFLPETDRKLLKRIKKASRISAYREAVNAIFGDDER